jgi:DNA-binding transcriptional regulator YdaS (Cro superfamily)
MTAYDEERLGELLRLLPPTPSGWAEAAKELPAARAELDALVARAEEDAVLRQALVADLEEALRSAGIQVHPAVVEHLRKRLVA